MNRRTFNIQQALKQRSLHRKKTFSIVRLKTFHKNVRGFKLRVKNPRGLGD